MKLSPPHFGFSLKVFAALIAITPTSICTRRDEDDQHHRSAAHAARDGAAFLIERTEIVRTAWSGPIVGLPSFGASAEARVNVKIDDGPIKTFTMRRAKGVPVDFDPQAAATALGGTLVRIGANPPAGQPATYRLELVGKQTIEITGDDEGLLALSLRRGKFRVLTAGEFEVAAQIFCDDLLVDDAQTGGGASRLGDVVLRAESAIRAAEIFIQEMGGLPAEYEEPIDNDHMRSPTHTVG